MFDLKARNLKNYEKTAQKYEDCPIQKGMILFYGSSGFTRWATKYDRRPLEEDIRMKNGSPAAVNHGFGGGTIEEGLYYYPRLVKPWEPRAIVLRFFPNDIRLGYSPAEVVYMLALFCNLARTDMPGVKLYLCDAMPHKRFIDNATWQQKAHEFNKLLKEYCDANEDCTYVSQLAWRGFYNDPADLGDYNKIRQDIWIEDEVHFTQEGYDTYRELFLETLNDIL